MNRRINFVMCVLFVLSGCSKLTLENYNKISVGMEYDAVVELIGPPENATTYWACGVVSGATRRVRSRLIL